jgi:SET domain-containing protein
MLTTKKKVLQHLKTEVFCRLGVSPIHGIGVFALRDIPKGINPLKSYVLIKEIDISKADIQNLPQGVRDQIDTFCYYDKKSVTIPSIGLNSFDMAIYLNHSKKPNLRFKKNGTLESIKAVAKGEEMFIDYDISFGEKHYF